MLFFVKNSGCKALKAKGVLHGTTWPKDSEVYRCSHLMLYSILYILGCDSIQGADFSEFSWPMESMYVVSWPNMAHI